MQHTEALFNAYLELKTGPRESKDRGPLFTSSHLVRYKERPYLFLASPQLRTETDRKALRHDENLLKGGIVFAYNRDFLEITDILERAFTKTYPWIGPKRTAQHKIKNTSFQLRKRGVFYQLIAQSGRQKIQKIYNPNKEPLKQTELVTELRKSAMTEHQILDILQTLNAEKEHLQHAISNLYHETTQTVPKNLEEVYWDGSDPEPFCEWSDTSKTITLPKETFSLSSYQAEKILIHLEKIKPRCETNTFLKTNLVKTNKDTLQFTLMPEEKDRSMFRSMHDLHIPKHNNINLVHNTLRQFAQKFNETTLMQKTFVYEQNKITLIQQHTGFKIKRYLDTQQGRLRVKKGMKEKDLKNLLEHVFDTTEKTPDFKNTLEKFTQWYKHLEKAHYNKAPDNLIEPLITTPEPDTIQYNLKEFYNAYVRTPQC